MSEPAIQYYGARCGYRCGNAGDEIGPLIVEKLSGRKVAWCGPEYAELVACGSIAQDLGQQYTRHVWGVGLMFETQRVLSRAAKVHAVRGHLTLRRWDGLANKESVAIGDPGLLVADLFPVTKSHRYPIGFVPHYVDSNNELITSWIRRHPGMANVIDICGHPENVLAQMAECSFILSSSLHGLIFADSLRIPNAWCWLSDGLAGGTFKFRDYYSAFGYTDVQALRLDIDTTPGDILALADSYSRPGIEALKANLYKSFPFPKPPEPEPDPEQEAEPVA